MSDCLFDAQARESAARYLKISSPSYTLGGRSRFGALDASRWGLSSRRGRGGK